MSSTSDLIRQQKKEEAERHLISTLKFCVIFLPLVLLYCTANQLSARREDRQYDRDCPQRNAPAINAAQADAPCTYTRETAYLNDVTDSRGRTQEEEVHLTDASGVRTTVTLDHAPTWGNWSIKDNRLSPSVVDGPRLVERWHGKVTSIYTATLKLTSSDNPDLRYGGVFFQLMSLLFLLFLISCMLLWRKTGRRRSRSDYLRRP
ncbi:MAG: hypothetical protein JO250_11545 [Armatimonadetes bacterium]|nr:hypothetical protein [Armatimonadota bacterium]